MFDMYPQYDTPLPSSEFSPLLDRASAPSTAREALDRIDAWLVHLPKDEADRLVAILSALRGPDLPELESAKSQTTAILRVQAFPRATRFAANLLGDTNREASLGSVQTAVEAYPLELREGRAWHFFSHVRSAVRALRGLRPYSQQWDDR